MGFNFLKNNYDMANSAKITVVAKMPHDMLIAQESYIASDQLQYVLANLMVIRELFDNKDSFNDTEADIYDETIDCWLEYANRIEPDFADYLKTQFDNDNLPEDEWPFIHEVYNAKDGDTLAVAQELILVAGYGLYDAVRELIPYDSVSEKLVVSVESVFVDFNGEIKAVTFDELDKLLQAILTIAENN